MESWFVWINVALLRIVVDSDVQPQL